jgi:hypothetical protein
MVIVRSINLKRFLNASTQFEQASLSRVGLRRRCPTRPASWRRIIHKRQSKTSPAIFRQSLLQMEMYFARLMVSHPHFSIASREASFPRSRRWSHGQPPSIQFAQTNFPAARSSDQHQRSRYHLPLDRTRKQTSGSFLKLSSTRPCRNDPSMAQLPSVKAIS